jgi:hypothetical protein
MYVCISVHVCVVCGSMIAVSTTSFVPNPNLTNFAPRHSIPQFFFCPFHSGMILLLVGLVIFVLMGARVGGHKVCICVQLHESDRSCASTQLTIRTCIHRKEVDLISIDAWMQVQAYR